jgi:hypothetical protein
VWKHVKHDRIGRAGVTGPEDLKAKALAALHQLQSSHIWCAVSSGTRTCATSPPEQSTYLHSTWYVLSWRSVKCSLCDLLPTLTDHM